MKDDWATVENVLADLPRSNPDAARSERLRARCHKTLARKSGRSFKRAIESAVVGGFCAVYLCVVALLALHSHGLL